jgi:transcriptional regulator with XRE-family HTH domain
MKKKNQPKNTEVKLEIDGFMKAFGEAIRKTRRHKKIPLQELSNQTGLSAGSLSQIERSKMAPSLSSIFTICHFLDLSIPVFSGLSQPTPDGKRKNALLVKRGEERLIHAYNGVGVYLLYSDKDKTMELLKNVYGPHTSTGGTPYTHESEEWGMVLKGVLRVELGEEAYILQEGDSISFDGRIPHKLINIHDGTTIYVWLNTPPVWSKESP